MPMRRTCSQVRIAPIVCAQFTTHLTDALTTETVSNVLRLLCHDMNMIDMVDSGSADMPMYTLNTDYADTWPTLIEAIHDYCHFDTNFMQT